MSSFSRITHFFKPYTAAGKAHSVDHDRQPRQSSTPLSDAPTTIETPDRCHGVMQDKQVLLNRTSPTSGLLSGSSLTSLRSSQETPRPLQTGSSQYTFGRASSSDIESTQPVISKFRSESPVLAKPQKPAQAPAINSSFSSTASRRIVVNNVKAVTNSDSEGLSDSSDGGLLDLDELFPRKRRRLTPPAGSIISKPFIVADDPVRTTLSRAREPHPRKKYKHGLMSIAKQHKVAEASEGRIRESEALLDAEQKPTSDGRTTNILADEVLSDEDDQERIKAAIHRIEVMDDDKPYYFFTKEGTIMAATDFPSETLPPPLRDLCKTSQRQSFFTSGFAADIVQKKGVSDDLIIWINDQLLHEPSPQVCEAYLSVLEVLEPQKIPFVVRRDCLLSTRYAGQTCLDEAAASHQQPNLPQSLTYILRSQRLYASQFSNEHRVAAMVELVLLNADDRVAKSPELCTEIEYTLLALFDQSEETRIKHLFPPAIEQILQHKTLLQHQLYHSILRLPSSTPILHKFRRLLALHCILTADATDLLDPASPDNETRLLVRLRKDPRFSVRSLSNWSAFRALTHVLDIAIDDGFSDFTFLDTLDSNIKKQSRILEGSSCTSREEQLFNRQIDDICKRLHIMLNNIKDGGTTNLKHTEAKHILESLCLRLEYSARTKPKLNTSVFGGMVGSAQRNFLEDFLKSDKDRGPQKVDVHSYARSIGITE